MSETEVRKLYADLKAEVNAFVEDCRTYGIEEGAPNWDEDLYYVERMAARRALLVVLEDKPVEWLNA